jgi:hypothetical protein
MPHARSVSSILTASPKFLLIDVSESDEKAASPRERPRQNVGEWVSANLTLEDILVRH